MPALGKALVGWVWTLIPCSQRPEGRKRETERDCQGLCRWRLSDQSICMSLHRFTKMSKSYGGGVVWHGLQAGENKAGLRSLPFSRAAICGSVGCQSGQLTKGIQTDAQELGTRKNHYRAYMWKGVYTEDMGGKKEQDFLPIPLFINQSINHILTVCLLWARY